MRKFLNYTVVTALVASVFGVFLPLQAVMAQDGLTISVSPPILEIRLNPGESVTEKIQVTSTAGGGNLLLSTDVKDFYYDDSDQLKFMTADELSDPDLQKFSLKNWIKVDQNVTVPAKQSKEVQFTVTAPKDAARGGHYGMIFFGKSTAAVSGGAGVGIGGQIGVMVLVSISGESSREGAVSSPLKAGVFDTKTKTFTPKLWFADGSLFKNGPVDFSFKFQNNSDTHYVPEGNITVKNIFGSTVEQFSIEKKRVFPGSERAVYGQLKKDFLLGFYTAELDVIDQTGIHHFSKAYFVGLPLQLIILLLTAGGLTALFFKFYNKWLTKQILKQYNAKKSAGKNH